MAGAHKQGRPLVTGTKIALALTAALLASGCQDERAADSQPGAERVTAAVEPGIPVVGPEQRILAFGDSLFAGYNVQPEESYPARLQTALRARGVQRRGDECGRVLATRQRRVVRDWRSRWTRRKRSPTSSFWNWAATICCAGLPPAQTRENLAAMLAELRRRNIPVLLMGMRAPPNLGADFVNRFDAIYPELAREYDADLVPFFLESIYTKPQLIQPDRVHPTAQGIETLVGCHREQRSSCFA
jgi:acyl-CoA thioesterase-1